MIPKESSRVGVAPDAGAASRYPKEIKAGAKAPAQCELK
jgi:hypothetical protein